MPACNSVVLAPSHAWLLGRGAGGLAAEAGKSQYHRVRLRIHGRGTHAACSLAAERIRHRERGISLGGLANR